MSKRAMQSDYMHWAKFKPTARFSLTGSEVPHFRMDQLPVALVDLDMDGASHPRYRPLTERIAAHYSILPEQVVAADGTSMANFIAMAALISPGDQIVIEHPTYEPVLKAASFLGATITRFERNPVDAFRLDPMALEKVLTTDARLIVLTNLHNPSSALSAEEELRAFGHLAARVGARILVDEVYLDSAVPRPLSAIHLGPEFVVTNSLTKVYGLSGLRCGWILAEPLLAERLWRVNDLFGVNQAHQAERLACMAFDHLPEVIGEVPAMLRTNRTRFNAFVESRGDLDCMPASQGITAFPKWSGGDTRRLDDHLRLRHDTAVVPGHWFEMPDHFRIGFGLPSDEFEQALVRLGSGLDELQ